MARAPDVQQLISPSAANANGRGWRAIYAQSAEFAAVAV